MLKEKVILTRALTFFLILFFVAYPVLSETEQIDNAHAAGTKQAEMDAQRTLPFILGCITPVVGLLISYLVPFTTPPGDALVGKSSEYAYQYTDAYNRKVKSIQGSKALLGCLISGGLIGIYYVFVFVLAIGVAADSAN